MSEQYGETIKQMSALFGSLIVSYVLFAVAAEVSMYLGRPAAFGPTAVGFFATLFLTFGWFVDFFDITPPEEFREVSESD